MAHFRRAPLQYLYTCAARHSPVHHFSPYGRACVAGPDHLLLTQFNPSLTLGWVKLHLITSNLEFFLGIPPKSAGKSLQGVRGYAHSVNIIHRKLLAVAGIDTSQDSKEVYHNSFCSGCYLTLQQIQAADLSGNIRDGTMSFRMGPPPRRLFHMETLRIIRERRGGRSPTKKAVPYGNTSHHPREEGKPRKQKHRRGRPKEDGKHALHQHILNIRTCCS